MFLLYTVAILCPFVCMSIFLMRHLKIYVYFSVVISGERFRGFLLQARSLLGAGRRIGGFVEPLPAGSKFLECDGDDVPHTAITHDCGHAKQDLKFLWPTPRYDVGPVQFM